MSPDRKFYVYIHRRATDGSIFYVGKGIKSRATLRSSRSRYWLNIVRKNGLTVEIIHGPMPEACAFSLESALIHAIGINSLCNISTGGSGGMSGYKFDRNTVDYKAKKCMKPVINSNGDVFASLKDAAIRMREIGHIKATESHISSCCNGKRHMAYGFSWSFDVSKTPKLIDHVAKVNEKRTRSVVASNGMKFDSISDAASWVKSELGVKCGTSDISRCCKGKRRICGGLEWRYLDGF